MAIALTLCLDSEAAKRVDSLCAALAERGISDYAARLGYRPHLTLLRGTEIDMATVLPGLRDFAADLNALAVRLDALSVFAGDSPVLWLALSDNPPLSRAQAGLYEVVSSSVTGKIYSDPDTWIPHVTLAEGLTDAALVAAMDVLTPSFGPIDGQLNRLELVRFPPVHIEWGADLRTADGSAT